MIDYGYTAASLLTILVAVVVDLFVLRTRILRTKAFWASYGIVFFFQLIVNGVLTGFGIVQYDPRVIIGIRLAYAPLEDLGFGFGLVTMTLSLWARLEHNARQKRRAPIDAPATTSPDRFTDRTTQP
jgi:lycopene cyclase domain-containing protein